MEQLLQDVHKLLEKGISNHYYDYVAMHARIFGNEYRGCKCKAGTLYTLLYNWYQQNKIK